MPRHLDTPLDWRRALHEYERAAATMRSESRGYAILAANVEKQDIHSTFAEGIRNELVRTYEKLAVFFAEQADTAQETADHYRALLDARVAS